VRSGAPPAWQEVSWHRDVVPSRADRRRPAPLVAVLGGEERRPAPSPRFDYRGATGGVGRRAEELFQPSSSVPPPAAAADELSEDELE